MGRQYNYFISPKEEIDFAKYLFDNGFSILAPKIISNDEQIVEDWSPDMLQTYNSIEKYNEVVSFLFKTYIYKREWGSLKKSSEDRIDFMTSPVIEHFQCTINERNNNE